MQADNPRRHDLDWLRVIATFVLFPFHAGKVFDVPPFFHIKNAQLSENMGMLTGFINFWHMPLFFILAGWALNASLEKRGVREFLKERVTKLFVPFLIGTLTMGPFMKYAELRVVGPKGFHESFLEFLPTFFTQLDRFTWGHLWFLIYLFTFTLLYLPVFLRLKASMARWTSVHPIWVYLPAIPLALVQILLRSRWPGYQNLYNDWANFTYYSLYLFLGFLLGAQPAFEKTFQGQWKRAGLIGLVAALALVPPTISYTMELILATTAGYGLVVFFLGAAVRYLNFSSPMKKYLTEAAFPIYLLHQTVIIAIGYYVIRLPK